MYSDHQQHWDSYLPSVGCAIRTLVHEATGFTPYFVNYGREQILRGTDYAVDGMDEAGDIAFDRTKIPEKRPAQLEKIFTEVRRRLDRAQEQARKTLQPAS